MRRCKIFSSILTLLLVFCFQPASAQIVSERSAVFLPVTEDEPQAEVTMNVANEGEAVSFRVRVIPGELDLENRAGRDDRGGPDEMEYEWRDSNEDDGPRYDWIDLTDEDQFEGVQTYNNAPDDGFSGMWDLGFDFPYYGEVYNSVGAHTNGFTSFDNVAAQIGFFYPQWAALPNDNNGGPAASSPPPTMISVNYQDLNPAVAGDILFWTDDRMAVVSWVEVAHFADDQNQDPWSFQLILTSDGFVKFQYRDTGVYDQNQEGNPDMMVGLQNEARDLGFTCAIDTRDYLEAEMAIGFGTPDAWVNWLTVEPEEVDLENGSDVDLVLSFDAEDLDAGYYYCSMLLDMAGEAPDITIPVVMSFAAPVGGVSGVVTDASNGNRIDNASITLNELGYTVTGSEFSFEDLPVGLWSFTVTAPNFNRMDLDQVEIVEGEVTELEIELLHGTFTLDRQEIIEQLAPDTDVEIDLTARNDGNAPVNFTAERRLLGDANAEPWDLRRSFDWGAQLQDDRLQGVAFANGMFYVAGAAGENTNQIYVLNNDGELVDQFDQVGEARYGMKDLAFDGEFLWGSGEQDIFRINLEGNLEQRFRGPFNPANNIAWDPDRELLWVCGTTTDIQAVDRDGNAVGGRLNRRAMRIYGLGYFPEDPDGFNLYILNVPGNDAGILIHKMNLENGDTMLVRRIDPVDATAVEGLEITNTYDIYSWVVVSVIGVPPNDGGDRVEIYQLDARKDWMQIDPVEGVVEADSELDFTLTLDANGLPEAEFEGEILFTHDGRVGETHLPITLGVVLGPVQAERDFPLARGWNLISANLQPDEEDVTVLTRDLVDNGLLLMMKDGSGHFYRPAQGFNNIPGWSVEQGYQMKLTAPAVLTLSGMTVMADDAIQLREGWQIVSYYPRLEVDPRIALAGMVDHLIVVKDGFGNFYLPSQDFSNMPAMREGQGYQIKTDAEVELIYRQRGEVAAAPPVARRTTKHFERPIPTGGNMSLHLNTDLGKQDADWEIGAFTPSGLCVGAASIQNQIGLAVWADDPTTPEIDGAIEGEALNFRLWDGTNEIAVVPNWEEGDGTFKTDDLAIAGLDASSGVQVPVSSFQLYPSFPNPFNSTTVIGYGLPKASPVEVSLFDQTGRLVRTLSVGVRNAGRHELTLEAGALPSGLYIVNVSTPQASLKAKVMLIR